MPLLPYVHPFPLELPSSEEMAQYDRTTIEGSPELPGTPSLELMERAAQGIASILLTEEDTQAPLVILCGPGNNGGDGLAVARMLQGLWIGPLTLVVAGSSKYSGEFLYQLQELPSELHASSFIIGTPASPASWLTPIAAQELSSRIPLEAIVLDALLGNNQKRSPQGTIQEILSVLAPLELPYVVAIDTPTGICPTTGERFTPSLSAYKTIAIQYLKRGMLQYPARECCGDFFCVDIGIPAFPAPEWSLYTSLQAQVALPARKGAAHKGSHGKVIIVGGSEAMQGAPSLTALGALSAGAGIVRACIPSEGFPAQLPREAMWIPCRSTMITEKEIDAVPDEYLEGSVLVVGPGMGVRNETKHALRKLLIRAEQHSIGVVLDADAITLGAQDETFLPEKREKWVWTPHPGEAARLLQCSPKEIQQDRFSAIASCQGKFGGTFLLKGAGTLTYSSHHRFVNPTGNAVLATPGSGDVLSGVIGALLAQGLSPEKAAPLGAFIHGYAADLRAQISEGPMLASELCSWLSRAWGELQDSEHMPPLLESKKNSASQRR